MSTETGTYIIIRRTEDGHKVIQRKHSGLNKGDTVLGTFCGGRLGATLAIETAKTASEMILADDIIYDAE